MIAKHFGLGALFGAGLGIGAWIGLAVSSNLPAIGKLVMKK